MAIFATLRGAILAFVDLFGPSFGPLSRAFKNEGQFGWSQRYIVLGNCHSGHGNKPPTLVQAIMFLMVGGRPPACLQGIVTVMEPVSERSKDTTGMKKSQKTTSLGTQRFSVVDTLLIHEKASHNSLEAAPAFACTPEIVALSPVEHGGNATTTTTEQTTLSSVDHIIFECVLCSVLWTGRALHTRTSLQPLCCMMVAQSGSRWQSDQLSSACRPF
jgi:hypothetical protein